MGSTRGQRAWFSRASVIAATMAAAMATVGFVVVTRTEQFGEYPEGADGRYAIPLPGQTRHLGGQTRHLGSAGVKLSDGLEASDDSTAPDDPTSPDNPTSPEANIRLSDDDSGIPLFDLAGLAPGHQARDCIAVTYDGDASHALIKLALRAVGPLAPGLITTVEVGAGGHFRDCNGFTAKGELFHGSLAEFAQKHSPEAGGLVAFSAQKRGQTATFRFTFELTDHATQGASVSADFLWTASA